MKPNRLISCALLVLVFELLVGIIAMADGLPDAPTPKATVAPKPDHSKRIWLTETAVLGGLYAADFTLTARGIGPKAMEADPLYGHHPSNGRIIAITAAQFGYQTLILRKTERSRHAWVRWAGRAGFAYVVADEIRAIHSWKR